MFIRSVINTAKLGRSTLRGMVVFVKLRNCGYWTIYRKLYTWQRMKYSNMDLNTKAVGHIGICRTAQILNKCFYSSDVSDPVSERHNGCSLVKDLVSKWSETLSKEGVSEPDMSVSLIVAHALGKKMLHDVDVSVKVAMETERKINNMCKMRLDRVPVQYIIGEWDFHDLILEMRPPVLIPRPETEELVALVTEDWKKHGQTEGIMLDIGCGSGAISLYLLSKLSQVCCVAVDVNEEACDLTLHNAQKLDLHHRLTVIHGDIQTETTTARLKQQGPFDVIVSNPPYITTDEMDDLPIEIHGYEDHQALHGGTDGLHIIKHILNLASTLLKEPKGRLWFEVGLGHPEMICTLINQHPEYNMRYIDTFSDFNGRERFCKLGIHGNSR